MYKIFAILFLLCLFSRISCEEKNADVPDILQLIPENARESEILRNFHQKQFLGKQEFYKPDLILTRKDVAIISVALLIKVDDIKDYGLGYFLTFDDLTDLLYLLSCFAEDIYSLFPEKIDTISRKTTRLEKRLNQETKILDEH
ncbi:MAG: hypothetical protein PHW04_09555 [Candidatus Wallbacteria bacterium]|nr:hypothetical protein [Candidatus Wallbacteria bacterium]